MKALPKPWNHCLSKSPQHILIVGQLRQVNDDVVGAGVHSTLDLGSDLIGVADPELTLVLLAAHHTASPIGGPVGVFALGQQVNIHAGADRDLANVAPK